MESGSGIDRLGLQVHAAEQVGEARVRTLNAEGAGYILSVGREVKTEIPDNPVSLSGTTREKERKS
jgi:hypothetical protein